MSNVLEMPEAAVDREGERLEVEGRKREAQYHWRQVTNAAVLQSRNTLRIGFHALAIEDKGYWGLCGFRDKEEARDAADVSESTWYQNIRLAEHFRGVSEEQFVSMKQANAKAACDLPQSKRVDPQWLEWAAREPIKAFAKRVQEEMEGKARPSGTVEPSVPFKAQMAVSQRRAVTEGLRDYAEKTGIDPSDTGTVLETMVAEQREGVSLVGTITAAVQHIKAIKEIIASGVSADEALEQAQTILDDMVLEFAAALQCVGQVEEAA